MISRYVTSQIKSDFGKQKIVILYGPRQVGKTTIAKELLAHEPRSVYYNCDQEETARLFSAHNLARLSSLVGAHKFIVIDEAQRVPGIGISLKILIDNFSRTSFLVTGSSSFELAQKIHEPLTGRHFTHTLFPIALCELAHLRDRVALSESLEEYLLFGGYPDVVSSQDRAEKRRRIEEITADYLFADALNLSVVKDPGMLRRLLQAVALQIGSEVSTAELANLLGIDRKTVVRYLDVCEKLFILVALSPHLSNKRNAIAKRKKYYFLDVGIRNALINNFNALSLRADSGALFENYAILERMKRNAARERRPTYTFWRSYQGREIDLIEELDGKLEAFEIKLSRDAPSKGTREYFLSEMRGASFSLVNRDTLQDFAV